MRILWLKSDVLLPLDKGGRLRSWHLMRHLATRHAITYLSFADVDQPRADVDGMRAVAEQVETIPRRDTSKGSALFYAQAAMHLFDPLPYSVGKYRSPAFRSRLRDLLRRESFDLIVCDFLPPAVNMPATLPCPAVLFTHNVEAEIWRRHAETAPGPIGRRLLDIQHKRMLRFEGRTLRRFDGVLAVSEADRDTFERLYGSPFANPIHVVPTGVDTRFFAPMPAAADRPTLVFTGSMDWLPNEDAMLHFCRETLPRIKACVPGAALTIVGRAPTPAVAKLAAIDGVTVTGRVDDVRPFVAEAAVYVVPLRIGGGTRLKIFEAMAMGKAVVSTTVGAEGLPVTDGRHLVLADDPDRFARSVVGLLNDGARAAALGEAARALVVRLYDWSAVAGSLEDALVRFAGVEASTAVVPDGGPEGPPCVASPEGPLSMASTGGPLRDVRRIDATDAGRTFRSGSLGQHRKGIMKVSVFGLGYVGCVSAASFAADGHEVVGVDVNVQKTDAVNAGRSPVVEPGLEELLQQAVAAGRLRATANSLEAVNATDVSLLCVGTPSRRNGSLDLTYLERVAVEVGRALRDKDTYHVVVVRSTVLPGTTHGIVIPAIERESGKKYGVGFGVSVNPEFLREGTALRDFRTPPLTLVGHNHAADATGTTALYQSVDAPIVSTSIRVAEMMKYTSNTWHALKVCFANEIGNICKRLEIDSHQVMDVFCLDEKLNLSSYYLKPGFAFGGSCLPKDVRALQYRAKEIDVETPLLSAILPSNGLQIQRAIDQVLETGRKKIGLLGFSFKSGTDDLRESPMVILAEALLGKGCSLKIYDRNVSLARLVGANRDYIGRQIPHLSSLLCEAMEEVVEGSDVVVVGNNLPECAQALERCKSGQIVIDLVRVPVDSASLQADYQGICW